MIPPLPDAILRANPTEAWKVLRERAWTLFSPPLPAVNTAGAILERERLISNLELLLSNSAWELWEHFETVVPRSSEGIIDFWEKTSGGKAVLILDALSLRETAFILEGAASRGFTVQEAGVRGSELPSDTKFFARALGFGGRASLENDAAGSAHRLPGARTESINAAWGSCADWVQAAPNVVLWHHWPDHRIHDLASAGTGFQTLCTEIRQQLESDAFWSLLSKLSTGRSLLITSDHGYAVTGQFSDVPSGSDQGKWLKNAFGSSRYAVGYGEGDPFLPPLSLALDTIHGPHRFALGRRRWKSQGGYPTLAHGGLSLLETFVPFITVAPR